MSAFVISTIPIARKSFLANTALIGFNPRMSSHMYFQIVLFTSYLWAKLTFKKLSFSTLMGYCDMEPQTRTSSIDFVATLESAWVTIFTIVIS